MFDLLINSHACHYSINNKCVQQLESWTGQAATGCKVSGMGLLASISDLVFLVSDLLAVPGCRLGVQSSGFNPFGFGVSEFSR